MADALNIIKVYRRAGKDGCQIPASKLIGAVLKIMQRENYIKEFEFVDDGKSGYFIVRGIGPINNCGVINPRFAVKFKNMSDFEQQYLPSPDFGIIIISAPEGVMTNREAKEKKIGGRAIAYVW